MLYTLSKNIILKYYCKTNKKNKNKTNQIKKFVANPQKNKKNRFKYLNIINLQLYYRIKQ